MRARFQEFGAFPASMATPNIGAFIAWGFLAAMVATPIGGSRV